MKSSYKLRGMPHGARGNTSVLPRSGAGAASVRAWTVADTAGVMSHPRIHLPFMGMISSKVPLRRIGGHTTRLASELVALVTTGAAAYARSIGRKPAPPSRERALLLGAP